MSAPADAAQPLAPTSKDQTALTSAEADILARSTVSDTHSATASRDASGRQPAAAAAGASELARTKITLLGALKHFPDFPIPGIKFIDILPLFQDPAIHAALLRALELQVLEFGGDAKPDVIVGLDARGFLFGPSLALRLDASFVPVRKKGKMPGPCVTAAYEKEYGTDFFQMQEGAVKPGQKVLVVDDIIATGGSAAAAGSLVKQLGGELIGYLFILEIPILKGRSKLDGVPTVTLLETDE
ncbi:adenine phosphoribosyltransferase [Madurella fahalii]|uniref:adenine phosphoribosyltransferase n=1 Tax=Madurella fahalii TaxID=1157608 RepID=A0ABQ0FXM0_9PEZI